MCDDRDESDWYVDDRGGRHEHDVRHGHGGECERDVKEILPILWTME